MYPVRDGLLEATSVFAAAAKEADVETVASLSQLSPGPDARLIGQVPTVRDITQELPKAYNRGVRYIAIEDGDWRRAAAERGVNPRAVGHLSQLWTFFRTSDYSGGTACEVTDAIERITGAKPTTFSEFLNLSMQDSKAVKRQLDAISTGA